MGKHGLNERGLFCPACFRSDAARVDGRCGACGFVATIGRCIDCGRESAGRIVAPETATSRGASGRAWWQPPLSAADRVELQERLRSLQPAFLCCDCMVEVVRAEARSKWWDALAAALAVPIVWAISGSALLRVVAAIVAAAFLSFALSAWSTRRAPDRRPRRTVQLLRRRVRALELERP